MLPGPEAAMDTKEALAGAAGGRCEDASWRAYPLENSPFFGTDTRCDGVVIERGSAVFGCLGVHTHATRA